MFVIRERLYAHPVLVVCHGICVNFFVVNNLVVQICWKYNGTK